MEKALVERIREYFNKRTRVRDTAKEADVSRRTLVIENGEAAGRLLKNADFALLFNLYRFNLLERLEESKDDQERISNGHYVAGVRDFFDFVEKSDYLAKLAT